MSRLVSYRAYSNGRCTTVVLGDPDAAHALAREVLTNHPGAVMVNDDFDKFTAQQRIVIDHGKGGPQ